MCKMVMIQACNYATSQIQYNYQNKLLLIKRKYFIQIWYKEKHKLT